jgi:outer membrane biosynthesis protein TonB
MAYSVFAVAHERGITSESLMCAPDSSVRFLLKKRPTWAYATVNGKEELVIALMQLGCKNSAEETIENSTQALINNADTFLSVHPRPSVTSDQPVPPEAVVGSSGMSQQQQQQEPAQAAEKTQQKQQTPKRVPPISKRAPAKKPSATKSAPQPRKSRIAYQGKKRWDLLFAVNESIHFSFLQSEIT